MDGLVVLFMIGAFILKLIKSAEAENKKASKKQTKKASTQWNPANNNYYNRQQETKKRLEKKYGQQDSYAAQAKKSDILSRAKENVRENDMDEIEQQAHAQVCKEFRDTIHHSPDLEAHRRQVSECADEEESDVMKRVNDLIIMGYSGDMNFERDFIAEGVEMLNQFSL